ncbi:MAG: glycerol-3-phosphate 1-O-acyltransferase PlsY [Verrucomicrobiae bacterium]|nr:glycerol-3-phosphate 1-O-acyltransferase PlsY [Verrucomicrobiae bacterium]
MNAGTAWIVIPLLGYLAGTFPFGYLCAKVASGMDIRREGSGNIGATNVARVLGPKWGILVLILDLLKGLLSVIFLPRLAGPELQNDLGVWAGFFAIIGHMYPIWLGFRGGKGVATALGVVLALSPVATAVSVTTFLFVVGSTRFVSLGSICAVTAFAVAHFTKTSPNSFTEQHRSLSIFSLVIPLMIIVAHRQNLSRLIRGEEAKLGAKNKPTE